MLGQRIVTALVLFALLVGTLLTPNPGPFLTLTLVLIAAAGWEWGRLNAAGGALALFFGALLAAACAGAWAAGWVLHPPAWFWWAMAALWVVGASLALRAGPPAWAGLPRALRWGLGLLALWLAWLAIGHARSLGVSFLISIFFLVWVADTAAYFGGRSFGRRKLAISISPGKTWEGVWSGMVGVLLLAGLWLTLQRFIPDVGPSVFSGLERRFGLWLGAAALLALAAMSVLGDLMESLVKRAAGAKDSSGLLPGHGGVLDRVDALLPVFPLALALAAP